MTSKDGDKHADLLSLVVSGFCVGHECEDIINALINVLADVIRYSIHTEYHDDVIDDLAGAGSSGGRACGNGAREP